MNLYSFDFIKYGVVDEKGSDYVIVDKILYKTRVFNSSNAVGDIVFFEQSDSEIIDTNSERLFNIKFVYSGKLKTIKENSIRKYIINRIDLFTSPTKDFLYKLLLNKTINYENIDDLGYGFCFYYILLYLKRKNKFLSLVLLNIYILLFKFDLKFYLFIFDFLVDRYDINGLGKLSVKTILIMLVNYHLLLNYSIMISLLINLIYCFDSKMFKMYFSVIQSILFNNVSILTALFFKEYIFVKSFMFLLATLTLCFSKLNIVFVRFISIYSFINRIFSIGIRGKLSIFSISIIFLIIKVLKIRNSYICYLIILLILLSPLNNPFKHVCFIDVGQGDSTLIKGGLNSYNVLIDTGSKYNYSKLRNMLYKEGVYVIDKLVITHNDSDHNGNIDNLKMDFKIKELVIKGEDFRMNNEYFDHLDIGNFNNDNDNSLVYLLNINSDKYLFTGDISINGEKALINKYNLSNINVLKVSHHGSNTSTSKYFLSKILTKYAIISTSGAYGHPAKEVLNNLDSFLVDSYITKDDGSIYFFYLGKIKLLTTTKGEFAII